MSFDSRPDTYAHIAVVRGGLLAAASDLMRRAHVHDASKLEHPECETFDRVSAKLDSLEYGSDEYKASLKEMGPALVHHYAHNSHHPEHHADGIAGMGMLDLIEMLIDWEAAGRRHADGDVRRSVEINQERFGYSDEIKGLLLRTLDELGL